MYYCWARILRANKQYDYPSGRNYSPVGKMVFSRMVSHPATGTSSIPIGMGIQEVPMVGTITRRNTMRNAKTNRRLPMFQAKIASTVKVFFENPHDDGVKEMLGTVIKIDKTQSLLPFFTVIMDDGTTIKMCHTFFNATVEIVNGLERRWEAA